MKEFNLERALAGDKVVTRDGREVTQLHRFKSSDCRNVVGVIYNSMVFFDIDGEVEFDNRFDLFMAPIKKQGWVNLFKDRSEAIIAIVGRVHESEEMAIDFALGDDTLIDTIMIEWEE